MDILSNADAKKCIGKKVFWDDIGSRYVFLRSGELQEVYRNNLKIDGDWKYLNDLTNLRSHEKGGHFKEVTP